MRLIIMRHGESQNNVLENISVDLWRANRVADPDLSAAGVAECR